MVDFFNSFVIQSFWVVCANGVYYMLNIKSLLLLANCLKDNSNFEMPLSLFFISILYRICFHINFLNIIHLQYHWY